MYMEIKCKQSNDCFIPDPFYLAMAINGCMRACFLFSQYASCLELTSPTQSVITFMLQNTIDGVGGLIAPYAVCKLSSSSNKPDIIHIHIHEHSFGK